jgi:hypothetical protein
MRIKDHNMRFKLEVYSDVIKIYLYKLNIDDVSHIYRVFNANYNKVDSTYDINIYQNYFPESPITVSCLNFLIDNNIIYKVKNSEILYRIRPEQLIKLI